MFFIFFSPFRSESKDFLCLKVRTNFHVDSWPLTLLLKKSRVSPICLMQTLYCWGGGFHSDNLFTEPARSGEKIQQMSKTCHTAHGGCGGRGGDAGNVQQHTAHIHIFWGGRYSCFCRCQIALKICCRAVIFESGGHLPFARGCLPGVLLCLVIGQFLLAD